MEDNIINNTCEALGITLSELADQAGVGPQYLSQAHAGTKPLTPLLRRKIAAVRRRHMLDGAVAPDEAHLLYIYRALTTQSKQAVIVAAEAMRAAGGTDTR